MRVSRYWRMSSMTVLPMLMIAACADVQPGDPSSPESNQNAATDLVSQSSAVVVDTDFLEDPPAPGYGANQCHGMHCCPDGYAMQGAYLDYNMFKCRRVQQAFPASTCYVDGPGQATYTTRANMHACKFGYYMQGLRVDQNLLTCCLAPNGGIGSEFVDGDDESPTQYYSSAWGVSAHTCPDHGVSLPRSVWVMSGIKPESNYFLCGF